MTELKAKEGTPLQRFVKGRQERGQDIVAVVHDRHGRRGTAKTTLSLCLGESWDKTPEGVTKTKTAIDAKELVAKYNSLPKKSSLVFDESEASLSKYRASSSINMMLRKLISMGRIRERYILLNLPSLDALDRDLLKLCDLKITVEDRGSATVYQLAHDRGNLITPKIQTLTWEDIPEDNKLRDVYEHLSERKDKKLNQLTGSDQEGNRKKPDELRREGRDKVLTQVYKNSDLTLRDLEDCTELSRSQINRITKS